MNKEEKSILVELIWLTIGMFFFNIAMIITIVLSIINDLEIYNRLSSDAISTIALSSVFVPLMNVAFWFIWVQLYKYYKNIKGRK